MPLLLGVRRGESLELERFGDRRTVPAAPRHTGRLVGTGRRLLAVVAGERRPTGSQQGQLLRQHGAEAHGAFGQMGRLLGFFLRDVTGEPRQGGDQPLDVARPLRDASVSS